MEQGGLADILSSASQGEKRSPKALPDILCVARTGFSWANSGVKERLRNRVFPISVRREKGAGNDLGGTHYLPLCEDHANCSHHMNRRVKSWKDKGRS